MEYLATLDIVRWFAIAVSALLAGITKAGMEGGTLLAVPLLTSLFGGRGGSSVMLGMLLIADFSAIGHYRKDGSLKHLARLLPWALIGVLAGAFFGKAMPDTLFIRALSIAVLVSAVLMAWREARGGTFMLPERWWIAAPLGILAGFASTVGNAAGPIMSLYLLSSGLGKGKMVGTAVWFFFTLNLVKLPFHIFAWGTLTAGTALAALIVSPLVIASVFLGVRIVRAIPEKPYRVFLICAAAVGGLYLWFK